MNLSVLFKKKKIVSTDTENKDGAGVASSSSVFGGNRGAVAASGTADSLGIYFCVCVLGVCFPSPSAPTLQITGHAVAHALRGTTNCAQCNKGK